MSSSRYRGVSVNPNGTKPIALVYRGPAGDCDACSEALGNLLESATLWNFKVIYVGPKEKISVQAGLQLQDAVLYAQPGWNEDLDDTFDKPKEYMPDVQNFVSHGGRYLDTCMGAYLVGNKPGYNLGLEVGRYIETPDATVKNEEDSIVQVAWRGKTRWMYFQDVTYFKSDSGVNGKIVLAYYTNGKVAAMVPPYYSGWIGVSGPHPEADASWYENCCLIDPDGFDADLGRDLIDTLMMQI